MDGNFWFGLPAGWEEVGESVGDGKTAEEYPRDGYNGYIRTQLSAGLVDIRLQCYLD